MEADTCIPAFRKAILSLSALNEKSLSVFISVFTPAELKADTIFCREGEYPLQMAFICQGIMCSFYLGKEEMKFIRGFYVQSMFLLPLPPFIYRKPSFLNFQAITDVLVMKAKYADIQAIARKDNSIDRFMTGLIQGEWIVNREIYEAGLHLYNAQTRCRLFKEKYNNYLEAIPRNYILSYLNISAKQFDRFLNL